MIGAKLLNDITTGRDNETHEVTRTFIVIILCIVVMVCCVGTLLEVIHFCRTGEFDLKSYFEAYQTFIPSIGVFLLTAIAALRIKPENSAVSLKQTEQPSMT